MSSAVAMAGKEISTFQVCAAIGFASAMAATLVLGLALTMRWRVWERLLWFVRVLVPIAGSGELIERKPWLFHLIVAVEPDQESPGYPVQQRHCRLSPRSASQSCAQHVAL